MKLEDFKKIIRTYEPSPGVIEQFTSSDFAVLVGPAVAGKDTLREGLIEKYPRVYDRVLSYTTRVPRSGEKESQAYRFISYDKMLELAQNHELLQIALVHNQQISATGIEEIEKLASGEIGLSILVIQTEQDLHTIKKDIKTIFLIPPSYEDLINRLTTDRLPDAAEIQRRLTAAKEEIKTALATARYQCIISDKQENVREIAHIFLSAGEFNKDEDARARKTMHSILEQL